MNHCHVCNEKNVGADHEVSEKHHKNQMFYDFMKRSKELGGNRKGVIISCSVSSSHALNSNCYEPSIKISAKPNDALEFKFMIMNETNKEVIHIKCIQLIHNSFNFVMNDEGKRLANSLVILQPKEIINKLSVLFKYEHTGQYMVPMMFSFFKPATNEQIVIIKNLMVFLEEKQTIHEHVSSPYALKDISAVKLVRSSIRVDNDYIYCIPKGYKPVYAAGLKANPSASDEYKLMCDDIKKVFETGVTKENYIRFFHNLLWYEETIVRINLRNYNMSGVPLTQTGQFFSLLVPGLSEKRPSLIAGDVLFIRPHNDETVMYEGIIYELQDNTVLIRGLHNSFVRKHTDASLYDIRFFLSRMMLERMHIAVNCVTDNSTEQKRVFPVKDKPKKAKPIKTFFNELVEQNPEQRSAVEHIVSGTSGAAPFLLHGPPGTGKTVTIVEAILQIVAKNVSSRVLVCTDSNMAADHVGTLLIKYMHNFDGDILLRANSRYRSWETLPKVLVEYSNGSNRDNYENVSITDFRSYNIVITTLSHAAKFAKEVTEKRYKRHITHVFIDEAAQASEPSAMIPVCGLLRSDGSLVLAGDPEQLGPVVISHQVAKLGLGLSLMERLKKTCPLYSYETSDPDYTVMLKNNFRSDPDILLIPNEKFYNNQLNPQARQDSLSKVNILDPSKPCKAIVFHGVLSQEQRMGKSPSFFNTMELDLVQQYIRALIQKHNVKPEDIGVVTPYIRQVCKVKSWLDEVGYSNLEVGTVEAFQGKEKRVIIISTVRARCNLLEYDAKFQLGFLVDCKRFNVALTRAKAKAIVIGNPLCLSKDDKWLAYMQKCREFGTYYGYDMEANNNKEQPKDFLQKITPLLKSMENKTKA